MELQKLLRADYLDILFEGRNKSYGGYELRRKYGKRTRKATASVIIGTILCGTFPLIAARISPDKEFLARPNIHETTLAIVPMVKPKTMPEIKVPDIPQPPKIANPVLVVVLDKDVVDPPKTVDELKGKEIGLKTTIGDADASIPSFEGPVGKEKEAVEYPVEKPKIYISVDQMPAFPGDITQYLNEHLRYPEDARTASEEGRVGIQFVVNEDGSISDAVVTHNASRLLNAEALRVVRSMPKWKPGKQGGVPVKVYFTLPVSFVLN